MPEPQSRVTLLFHTRNRVSFLIRALRHYDRTSGGMGLEVVISDGSTLESHVTLKEYLARTELAVPVHLMPHAESVGFVQRISDALAAVRTPYVMLAADDDLYFPEWINDAIAELNRDATVGVLYGHTVRFELESFVPYGRIGRLEVAEYRNPPLRWLEDGDVEARLSSLGLSNWATVGWYALQRTDALRIVVENAVRHQLDAVFFERYLTFCQVSNARVRKRNSTYLARQVNPDERREPLSFRNSRQLVEACLRASHEYLAVHCGVSSANAWDLVNSTYAGEIAMYRRADRFQCARRALDAMPVLRSVRSRLTVATPYVQDARLPPLPSNDGLAAERTLLDEATTGPS